MDNDDSGKITIKEFGAFMREHSAAAAAAAAEDLSASMCVKEDAAAAAAATTTTTAPVLRYCYGRHDSAPAAVLPLPAATTTPPPLLRTHQPTSPPSQVRDAGRSAQDPLQVHVQVVARVAGQVPRPVDRARQDDKKEAQEPGRDLRARQEEPRRENHSPGGAGVCAVRPPRLPRRCAPAAPLLPRRACRAAPPAAIPPPRRYAPTPRATLPQRSRAPTLTPSPSSHRS